MYIYTYYTNLYLYSYIHIYIYTYIYVSRNILIYIYRLLILGLKWSLSQSLIRTDPDWPHLHTETSTHLTSRTTTMPCIPRRLQHVAFIRKKITHADLTFSSVPQRPDQTQTQARERQRGSPQPGRESYPIGGGHRVSLPSPEEDDGLKHLPRLARPRIRQSMMSFCGYDARMLCASATSPESVGRAPRGTNKWHGGYRVSMNRRAGVEIPRYQLLKILYFVPYVRHDDKRFAFPRARYDRVLGANLERCIVEAL